MNLFTGQNNQQDNEPLAYRMRPRDFSDLYGQQEIVGAGKITETGH